MARKRMEARVHGYVQGVAFRWHTGQVASRLGLSGYVRNLPDGTVHVVAEGDAGDLGDLLTWLHAGPANAAVSNVETTWAEATGEFGPFEVRV